MKFLLDTNICIYILNERPRFVLDIFLDKKNQCVISSITVEELYYGVCNSSKREKNLQAVNNFIDNFIILSFDSKEAMLCGQHRYMLQKMGKTIGHNDLMIASVALQYDLVLVTNNEKEFIRIPNLKIENWAK